MVVIKKGRKMKSTILKLWIIAVIVLGVSSSLSAAVVSLTNSTITPAPLDRVEDNGVGIITFGMVESSKAVAATKDMHGEPNMKISVELQKLKLKDDSVILITGTLMKYFSATYDAEAKRIIFTQIAEFPAFGNANVSIPVVVTENSASTDSSLNGFNANISANDATTTADVSTSAFTYTK